MFGITKWGVSSHAVAKECQRPLGGARIAIVVMAALAALRTSRNAAFALMSGFGAAAAP